MFLEEAFKIPSRYPNAYNALGLTYTNEGKTKEALELFEKAMELDDHIDYQYNYAASLYYNGQTEEALKIFSRISKTWRDDETAEKAYYACGVIRSLAGDFESGIKVADEMRLSIASLQLLMVIDLPDIYGADLSDIYYVCGQYQRCVEMFEQDNMYPMAELYSRYVFAYNAINEKEQVLALCDKIIKEKDEALEEAIQDEIDEEWTQEDREFQIHTFKEEKKDLLVLFDRVMNKGYKPEIKFKPVLVYGCYLIGCPRHWNFHTEDKRT